MRFWICLADFPFHDSFTRKAGACLQQVKLEKLFVLLEEILLTFPLWICTVGDVRSKKPEKNDL